MRQNMSKSRLAGAALVLVAIAATSGCGWLRKESPLYAKDAASRPLEVPPELDLPRTDAAASGTPALASATAAPAAGPGFTVAGSREEVFGKVGEALGDIEGLTIDSRAPALGAYDVSFEGSNFLVRVSAAGSDMRIAAVDPRGQPATGDAAAKVMAALRTALAGD